MSSDFVSIPRVPVRFLKLISTSNSLRNSAPDIKSANMLGAIVPTRLTRGIVQPKGTKIIFESPYLVCPMQRLKQHSLLENEISPRH